MPRRFSVRPRRGTTPRRFRPEVSGLGARVLPSTIVANPPRIQTGVAFVGAQFKDLKDPGIPPDTSAAVGPKNVVEGVNSDILVFDRQGKELDHYSAKDFFSTQLKTLNLQNQVFDPRVVYDDIAKRFVVVFVDVNDPDGKESPHNPNRDSGVLVAVSPGDDATANPSDWTMLRIDAGKQFWADFPMVGYNADGLFIDVNMFHFSLGNGQGNNEGSGFHNARVYALDMANLNLDGVHQTDLPKGRFYTMYPAVMHGAQPGTPMEFVVAPGLKDLTVGRLTNTFGGRPEDFQFTHLPLGPAAAFGEPEPPSQPGEGDFRPGVDSILNSKVAAAAWRDNRLVVARTIGHSEGGLTTNVVRWYEVDTAGPKPQLQYFGSIFPGVGVDVYHPSIDINAAGDLGLTFMQSSGRPRSPENPSMYVADFPRSSFPAPPRPGQPAIRVRNDPATSIVLAKAGVAPLNSVGNENNTSMPVYRAGDYSSTAVDPVDNATFWAANEYATDSPRDPRNGRPTNNWGTFIQSFGLKS